MKAIRIIALVATVGTLVVGSPPAGAAGIGAELVKGGLPFPAGFTFDPDGRIFYGERFSGEIRVYDPATSSDTLFFTVGNLSTDGEQGLLGLAVDPSYPGKPYVYAYATRIVKGSPKNQILRITDTGPGPKPRTFIFTSDTTAGQYHDGGRILFGSDRKLYAIVGEGHSPANAQNLNNNAGKILRMNRGGKAPKSNPFPGKLIWVYGIRNSYGFTFDPLTDNLWEDEAGPGCNDEVNLIKKGRNYGWGPSQTCSTPPPPPMNTNQDGPNPVLPLAYYTPPITPVGNAFCVGCGLAGSEGTLFFGDYNHGQVHRVVLTGDRKDIASQSVVYSHSSNVLSMERGPDDLLYFSDPSGIWVLVNN